jgi:hypothetical protein
MVWRELIEEKFRLARPRYIVIAAFAARCGRS